MGSSQRASGRGLNALQACYTLFSGWYSIIFWLISLSSTSAVNATSQGYTNSFSLPLCLNKKCRIAKLKCLILNRHSVLFLRVYYFYILKFPHCIFIIFFGSSLPFYFSLNHCTRMCFDHLPNWNMYKNFWSIPIIVNWAVLPRQELCFSLFLSLKQKVFPLKKRKKVFCNIQEQWNRTLQFHMKQATWK